MRNKLRIPVVLLAMVSLLSACSTLQSPPVNELITDDYTLVKQYMRKFINTEMKKAQFMGLSVALVDSDEIVWAEGFGFADKKANTLATENTKYRAGSVSKIFTAISVMQQVEQGQLDLDKPLSDYVPEFNINSRFGSIDQITLRNTLSHHSGLPDSYIDGMWANEPESFRKVATYLNGYYTAFPPNSVFSYSNNGYSLAGHAVENSSGQSFSDYQEKFVLDPLGMSDSNFTMDTSDALVSKSYWRGKQVEELGLRDIPAGGLVTNVIDLSKLLIDIHAAQNGESKILKASTLNAMMKAQQYDSAYELTRYNGIGFMLHPKILNGVYDAVGHGGQTMAHSALVISIPELEIGAVLLANSANLSGQLEDIMAELLKVAAPVKTRAKLDLTTPKELIPLPGSKTDFNERYAGPFGLVKISGGPKKYEARAVNQRFSLKPNDSDEYKAALKLFGLFPIAPKELRKINFYARDVNGSKMIIAEDKASRLVLGTQIKTQPINDAWHERLGTYTISNPIETDIEMFKIEQLALGYEDGFYYSEIKSFSGNLRTPLTVMNDTQAISQGLGRGLGETVLAQPDGSLLSSGLVLIKKN